MQRISDADPSPGQQRQGHGQGESGPSHMILGPQPGSNSQEDHSDRPADNSANPVHYPFHHRFIISKIGGVI